MRWVLLEPEVWSMRSETIQGVFWIGLAAVICSFSLRLPLGDVRQAFNLPGPGFFPLILGALLALLGVFLLVKPWIGGRSREGRKEANGGEKTRAPALWMNKKAFAVLISLIIYSALFERLGFLASTCLFLVLLFRGISSQKWATSIVVAIAVSFLSYLVFDVWLMAQFPGGIFSR